MNPKKIAIIITITLFVVLGIGAITVYRQISTLSHFNGIPEYVLLTDSEIQNEFRYISSERPGWVTAEHLKSGVQFEHPANWSPSETIISTINGKTITVWSILGPSTDDPPIVYLFSTDLPMWQARRLGFGIKVSNFHNFQNVTYGNIRGATQRWEYRVNGYGVGINRLTLIEKEGMVYGAYELDFPAFRRTTSDIVWSIRPIP